jgi:predicted TIM-barrel fold metal-dependent hydrolase
VKNIIRCLVGVMFSAVCTTAGFAQESTYVKSTDTYKRIKAAIDKIRVVDTHEHLRGEPGYLNHGPKDFFDLVGDYYNTKDKRYLDATLSVEERWQSFEPLYKMLKIRNYVWSIKTGIKKIYGIDITDAQSIKKINEAMKKQHTPGIYTRVLHDIGKIDYVMVHSRWKEGLPKKDYPDFFRGGRVIDKMVTFDDIEDTFRFAQHYGVEIRCIDDLEEIYKKFVDESVRNGAVGFKYSGAYLRDLDFSNPNKQKAEAVLQKMLRNSEAKFSWAGGKMSLDEARDLSTYLMHAMLRQIEKTKIPLAFHTGPVSMGSAGDVRRSNPQLLIPLFKQYPDINFDLYHSGFPYVTEFVELGKSWPNVYLNMCWSHNLTPTMARAQLSEMLECVPVNKILAYGGDSRTVENSIGDLEIAKENCAVVLAEKVLDGKFTEPEAIEYAQRILRTNAIELYKLDKVGN